MQYIIKYNIPFFFLLLFAGCINVGKHKMEDEASSRNTDREGAINPANIDQNPVSCSMCLDMLQLRDLTEMSIEAFYESLDEQKMDEDKNYYVALRCGDENVSHIFCQRCLFQAYKAQQGNQHDDEYLLEYYYHKFLCPLCGYEHLDLDLQKGIIYFVSEQKNLDQVQLFLERGADPNTRDRWGESLLHLAAISGNENIVSCLIDHKANVNSVNEQGHTPLIKAVRAGEIAIVNLLLEKEKGG